jgi:hypothetical protein
MPYLVETLVDAAGGQPRAKPLTVSIGLAASMPVLTAILLTAATDAEHSTTCDSGGPSISKRMRISFRTLKRRFCARLL